MIELKTFDKSRVNPVDDGVLYNALAGESGILTGCGMTAVGGAQVQIRDGYLILCGRVCKVSQEVLHANLSANGTQEGQLVAVIDLSNVENPIKLETRLPKGELMQGDINAGGTVYELEIATYTADELSVKSITTTANKIGLANKAALEAVSAELANKANIAALGQPSGIATLNSSGKLVQMPTAADVGAAPINIRQIDIKPLVPDNGGDLMCRCWINPWHEAHLMIRWSLRSPLTGTIEFAKLPDECLPIMAFDTPCILRSPSSGLEAGIVNIGWGGQISICRSTTSTNDTFTMLCANINYHTYY